MRVCLGRKSPVLPSLLRVARLRLEVSGIHRSGAFDADEEEEEEDDGRQRVELREGSISLDQVST
jgi:hypothetical protein